MDFQTRYNKLNEKQRQAVDTIDGPVLVVAGPGTGKTELLSMRAANILRKTDTLPENILCLTFTESGASSMRERLKSIIGKDAFKVAIHTFHSFGTEIINQNGEFFYKGANFRPADELSSYEILRGIFDELSYDNPLSSRMNDEYTYMRDAVSVISELKKNGLTGEELRLILAKNAEVIDAVEPQFAEIFAPRLSKGTTELLRPLIDELRELEEPMPFPSVPSLALSLADSLMAAVTDATGDNSTKPITAWRNTYLKKDATGKFIFKSSEQQAKLLAISHIYDTYQTRMEEAEFYDFDDMIMKVVHAMEDYPELRYNLQEKHLYIMVDEFQDTNLAQMRILNSLADNPVNEGRPNILAVGDDDQAIYSFQGADVSNIMNYQKMFNDVEVITLVDNYRSAGPILEASRQVITQGGGRLETLLAGVNKQLTAHRSSSDAEIELREYSTLNDERRDLVDSITQQISAGTRPCDIAVLARRHHEITGLLPYFAKAGIDVNYERRDNVLDIEPIIVLEQAAKVLTALANNDHDTANSLLPELMSHPCWRFSPSDIWKLSLSSYKERVGWIERMLVMPEFSAYANWLIELSVRSHHEPLEQMIDAIIGSPHTDAAITTEDEVDEEDAFAEPPAPAAYASPLYEHFFCDDKRTTNPAEYLVFLEALRTIRAKLREYHQLETPKLATLIEFIDLHRNLGSAITSIRVHADGETVGVNLMTAHKSKGLEYDTVYVIGSIDSMWGERVRSRSRLIGYPENLQLAPAGDSPDERMRLFFVAMTRAKRRLVMSYSVHDDSGKDTLAANFLLGTSLAPQAITRTHTEESSQEAAEIQWYDRILTLPAANMQQLLASTLENYKLSVTHLNNFLDVSRGGPQTFLVNNLLRFPQAMSPAAAYGSAIHGALQRAHAHLAATKERKPIEDILQDYEALLRDMRLTKADFDDYLQKGIDTLQAFLSQHYDSFTPSQKVELSFSGQQVVIEEARLSGALDLVDINKADKTIAITDYKTGKGSSNWKGKTDYEKIKLHKYRQQLMFYQLLVENSRDYNYYTVTKSCLQFVELDKVGKCPVLEAEFTHDELTDFKRLIAVVWKRIMSLDLPDISSYEQSYKGMLAFEQDLLASD